MKWEGKKRRNDGWREGVVRNVARRKGRQSRWNEFFVASRG
jgi:hypothetical protein